MRIAIYSDVHGNLAGLRAVLAALEAAGPFDHVVAAGDHALIGPRPAETLALLRETGHVLLIGNHDRDLVLADPPAYLRVPVFHARAALGEEGCAFLAGLPERWRVCPAPGQELLVVHASPANPAGQRSPDAPPASAFAVEPDTPEEELSARFGGTGAAVVAFGHYHHPFVRRWREGVLVNVASVSFPVDGALLASFSVLTWDGAWSVEQHRVPFDVADEAAAWAAHPECATRLYPPAGWPHA